MLLFSSRGFRRSNSQSNRTSINSGRRSLWNASASAIESLEGRVLMSVSASQLAGAFQTVGNHWVYNEVSTDGGINTINGSIHETVSQQTTDPDNGLSAFQLDETLFDGSSVQLGTGVAYIAPLGAGNGFATYGNTTTFANGAKIKTTYSPNSIELPATLTQGVPFGADRTYTDTTVNTPANGVPSTPVITSVQVSGVLISNNPAPLTTPLGVTYPVTYEVDITTTDTPQSTGIADTPDTQRNWFAPGKGLVLSEDADPSVTSETELASFDGSGAQGGTDKLAFIAVPASGTTGTVLSPITVYVENSSGTLLTGDTSTVTLSVANPAGTLLGGTTTKAAVGGVVTFSDITIADAGNYSLSVTDGALIGATSGTFGVSVPGGGGGGGGGVSSGITPAIVSSTVPSAVVGGAKLHGAIKTTLTNSLGTDEKGFTVNIYASTDASLDTAVDTLVTSVTKPSTIKAGKTSPLSIPITTLPASLPDGSYFLIAQTVDSASNTGSVSSATPIVIAAPFVTLSETLTTTLPPALVSGTTAKGTVTLTITNSGNVPSKGLTPINITASSTSGILGTSIATVSKNLNILPGKSAKVVVPIKNIPALADGTYFIVAQVTDPLAAGASIASSPTTLTIAAPFISLAATLTPVTTLKAGATLTLTNNGNIDDIGSFTATIGFTFVNPATAIGQTLSAIKPLHLKAGKKFTLHSNAWIKIQNSIAVGVPYLLSITVTDSQGNTVSALSPNSFTL